MAGHETINLSSATIADSRWKQYAASFAGKASRFWARRHDHCTLSALVLVFSLLALTLADAFLTLLLLTGHFEEANPLMRLLLKAGPVAFVAGKYLMTVIGLPILLVFRRRSVFFPWLRVEHILPCFVIAYVVLITYQLCLLQQM